jgi:hypothetical protein
MRPRRRSRESKIAFGVVNKNLIGRNPGGMQTYFHYKTGT